MTRIIDCQVTNEYVKGSGVVSGASLSHDDVILKLHFSDFWDNLTKKVMFTDAYGETNTLVILTSSMAIDTRTYQVPIPFEAKKYPGDMLMAIKGMTSHTETINKTGDGTTKEWTLDVPGVASVTVSGTATTDWTYEDNILEFTAAPANEAPIVITSTPIEDRATLSIACTFEVKESGWNDDAEEAQAISGDQAAALQEEIDDVLDDILEISGHIEDSEAYAVGKRGGTDVPSTDPAYHNNSKYYSEQASGSATTASTKAGEALASATSAASSASTAQSYTNNPPKPNNNNKWELWNGSAYVESAYPTRGEKGDTGDTGATGAAAGFGTPTATIDNNVGTPSVTVVASGSDTAKVFAFDFKNIKGQQGETGSTGSAAGFGNVTAEVDGNSGIPSVTVTASGSDTSKNFHFAFSNLKGQKGDAGTGSGDMLQNDYDANSAVKGAGGIAAYVAGYALSPASVTEDSLADNDTFQFTDTSAAAQRKTAWSNIKAKLKTYFDTLYTNVVESTVSGWGFTKNTGTITGITMNGSSKGTSGNVDLGTVITAHQSLSAYRTSSAQDVIDGSKQAEHSKVIGTLTTAGWSNNTQTINVTGVTATNTVIVSPAPASQEDYANSAIYCTAQASGTLTFTCEDVPTNAITVNVVILD